MRSSLKLPPKVSWQPVGGSSVIPDVTHFKASLPTLQSSGHGETAERRLGLSRSFLRAEYSSQAVTTSRMVTFSSSDYSNNQKTQTASRQTQSVSHRGCNSEYGFFLGIFVELASNLLNG
jgi:hypothetical protein